MVKRMLGALMLALLLPMAALAEGRVVDHANLFDSDEITRLEAIIQQIASKYQVDAVVLTTYDVQSTYDDDVIQDYADLYYENHGYGLGQDKAGLLYMIDMTNRAPCISTSGVMMDYITDSRLEELFDVSYGSLVDGAYGRAAMKVLETAERFLAEGREEGSFRYDAETGERLSGLYNRLTSGEMGVAVLVGIAVAAIMYVTVQSRYNLKGSTYAYDRRANAACNLTKDDEHFLRETRSVTVHSENNDSSSNRSGSGISVHHSSSGGSHGGGVGKRF